MHLKHLIQQFSYRIEPKPEGGFIARSNDPAVPPLEAPTREELQEKIQASMAAALAEAFPGLKIPLDNGKRKFEVHIERKAEGGFAVHSAEQGAPGTERVGQEKIDHFAEELLGFVDKNFPGVSKAVVARIEAEAGKALTNHGTGVVLNGDSQPGSAQNFPESIQSNCVNSETVKFGTAKTFDANFGSFGAIANNPITPQTSSGWPILRFLLTLLIIAGLMYFFLHRR